MGLFNLFKKPAIIEDDVFGTLRYIPSKDPSDIDFEGKGFFLPTNSEIGYTINADIFGPTEDQKKFYENFQKNFTGYVEKIKPLIEDEFRNWKEEFEISNFYKEFSLVFITIPDFNSAPLIWEIAFTTIHDENHHVTIDFIDDDPNGILIDG